MYIQQNLLWYIDEGPRTRVDYVWEITKMQYMEYAPVRNMDLLL